MRPTRHDGADDDGAYVLDASGRGHVGTRPQRPISWTATDASEVTGYSYFSNTYGEHDPDTTSEGSSVPATRSLGDGSTTSTSGRSSMGQWGAAIHRAIRVDVTILPPAHDAHALYDGMAATITSRPPTDRPVSRRPSMPWTAHRSVEGTSVIVAAGGRHTLAFASTDRQATRRPRRPSTSRSFPPQTDFDGPVDHRTVGFTAVRSGRWYLQRDAIVSWVATDATDVTGYAYAFDTTADTVPSTSTVITQTNVSEDGIADGTYYAHVRATDHYANWGETRHFMIKIDGTMPTTGANASTPSGEDATVTISATDALSGVARIDWVVDGGSAGSVTGSSGSLSATVSLTGVMLHHVDYSATDGAGNREATKTIDVPIPRPDTQYVAVEGPNRYATAVAASNLAFPDGADAVVIATGTNWPDALGGAALAGQVNGPILLTDPKTLPSAVQGEIVRLGATTAYLLGSEAAVSKAVADADDAIPGVSITRLAGPNRYATANAIARATTDWRAVSYDGTMFVADGLNFPTRLPRRPSRLRRAGRSTWHRRRVLPRDANNDEVARVARVHSGKCRRRADARREPAEGGVPRCSHAAAGRRPVRHRSRDRRIRHRTRRCGADLALARAGDRHELPRCALGRGPPGSRRVDPAAHQRHVTHPVGGRGAWLTQGRHQGGSLPRQYERGVGRGAVVCQQHSAVGRNLWCNREIRC